VCFTSHSNELSILRLFLMKLNRLCTATSLRLRVTVSRISKLSHYRGEKGMGLGKGVEAERSEEGGGEQEVDRGIIFKSLNSIH